LWIISLTCFGIEVLFGHYVVEQGISSIFVALFRFLYRVSGWRRNSSSDVFSKRQWCHFDFL